MFNDITGYTILNDTKYGTAYLQHCEKFNFIYGYFNIDSKNEICIQFINTYQVATSSHLNCFLEGQNYFTTSFKISGNEIIISPDPNRITGKYFVSAFIF